MKQISKDHQCPVCLNLYLNPVILPNCNHVFCFRCLKNAVDHNPRIRDNLPCPCPLCRKLFRLNQLVSAATLKETLKNLYPKQLKIKKQETIIEKTVKLILGHQFKKQNCAGVGFEDNPKKQLFSWKFFIRGFQSGPGLPRNNPLKGIQKMQIRLHPSLKNNIITVENKAQENRNFNFEVAQSSQTFFNFRIFIEVFWKQHCGGGKTEVYYDLDDKVNALSLRNQKLVKIQMSLRPS